MAKKAPLLQHPTIFVVSDSMGETAQLVAKAAMSQFPEGSVLLRRFRQVDTPEAAEEIMAAARVQPTFVIFTVVLPKVREVILSRAARDGTPILDLMGPALAGLEQITGRKPLLEPGKIHRLDERYFRRVEAIEFAVQHDDGKDPQGYRNADLVLLGVSRSSKTPVSMYLANLGIKVANLPLAPEIPLPREIHRLNPRKLVGLIISPAKLAGIRAARAKSMGVPGPLSYADIRRIRAEIAYAQEVYRELGCPVVDVTDRAVEETAQMVLELAEVGSSRESRLP